MSKPRNRWRPAIARPLAHRTAQLPIATCPDCGKRAYSERSRQPKNAARLLYPGQRMRVYQWRALVAHERQQGAAKRAEDERQACGGGPGGAGE